MKCQSVVHDGETVLSSVLRPHVEGLRSKVSSASLPRTLVVQVEQSVESACVRTIMLEEMTRRLHVGSL